MELGLEFLNNVVSVWASFSWIVIDIDPVLLYNLKPLVIGGPKKLGVQSNKYWKTKAMGWGVLSEAIK